MSTKRPDSHWRDPDGVTALPVGESGPAIAVWFNGRPIEVIVDGAACYVNGNANHRLSPFGIDGVYRFEDYPALAARWVDIACGRADAWLTEAGKQSRAGAAEGEIVTWRVGQRTPSLGTDEAPWHELCGYAGVPADVVEAHIRGEPRPEFAVNEAWAEFGRLVAQHRKSARLTREQLAVSLAWPVAAVRDVEEGRAIPQAFNLPDYLRAIGVCYGAEGIRAVWQKARVARAGRG